MKQERRLRTRTGLIHGEEEFEPRAMVAWFHPFELLRTAIRSVLAGVVTAYADSRISMTGASGSADRGTAQGSTRSAPSRAEQARNRGKHGASGRPTGPGPTEDVIDLSGSPDDAKDGFWFDYLADTGEGFDGTYAMASIVGRPNLDVEGYPEPLPRGRVLVLGGDMVYPWPSRVLYRDRFQVPFRWALPDVAGPDSGTDDERPRMVAIPGNHDWYDGLGNFLNVFCDGRAIGGWKTVQRRSYFAVKLPHGWTIWGIDGGLDNFTDRNQRAYFRSLSSDMKEHGDKVILCSPSPAWLHPWGDSRRNLRFFEEEVLRWPTDSEGGRGRGPDLPLVLSGDLHFYARHKKEIGSKEIRREEGAEPPSRHRIVCGGGGAYTRGTHDLPDEFSLHERETRRGGGRRGQRDARPQGSQEPDAFHRQRNRYVLQGPCYPDRPTSRRLALGALSFPFLSHNFPFLLGIGLWLATTAGVTHWASRVALIGRNERPDFFSFLRSLGQDGSSLWTSGTDLAAYLLDLLYYYPMAGLMPVLGITLFMGFFLKSNASGRRWTKWIVGSVWVAGSVLLLLWILFVATRWIEAHALWVLLAYAVASGFVAGLLTGFFLWLVNRLWGWNSNEVFSCQSIKDYHSFLRCNITKDGDLVIYPIGVEAIPRRWRRSRPTVEDHDHEEGTLLPILEPVEQPLRAHLIEPPITILAPRARP